MERTLALLAFDNPEDSPFGDLLNMMQRQKVKNPWGALPVQSEGTSCRVCGPGMIAPVLPVCS